jgi:hypothetical protein
MANQVKAASPGPSGAKSLLIPITNIYDGNDYSAQLLIGSKDVPANVILDTGSSTLAVTPKVYNAASDKNLKPTTLAQLVTYGTGGWAGPVVNTSLTIGAGSQQLVLNGAPIAITDIQQKNNFTGVDGIMGLAFNGLNTAFDFKDYLVKTDPKSPFTFPWPFSSGSFKTFTTKFIKLVRTKKVPEIEFDPYFTELTNKGVSANKFSFYTKRSWVHNATTNAGQIAKDPLNNGFFVLGGGEEQADLYTGNFTDVDVVHDLYYNTNLVAVQVDGGARIAAQALQSQYVPFMVSNSIVDSGTSALVLSDDVYQAILDSFQKLSPTFNHQIKLASQNGIAMTDLYLSKWPKINFIFTGINGGNEVTLSCDPHTYWQVNFPSPGQAVFQIAPLQQTPNQSIFGLPLMNNYYTVFDRSTDANGIIRFATIK